jgi:NAD(P)H-quinone oxidoreductase subunit 5
MDAVALSASIALAAGLVPVVFLLGGLLRPTAAVRIAGIAGVVAVAAAVGAAIGGGRAPSPWLRIDAVTFVVLLLVCGLGVVVVRYASTAVRGERRSGELARWLLLTLAAVSALVVSGHLVLIAAAWTATSIALHQLLTHEADRPLALLAAHKKFLVSRAADAALWSALVLIHGGIGGLELSRLDAWAASATTIEPSLQVAAILIVLAVALKSAQLPFHGWLTQVMEAPTPVSALLHAGVVNIGGLVLIRLAPFMAHMSAAQLLLVGIGLVTVVVAALVTLTRVSVKVALAWSTSAQMGFMLVQCGLGAWPLALLHLVAHSLYKAHAFLSAGSTVERWRNRTLHRPPAPSWQVVVISAVLLVALAGGGVVALSWADLVEAGPSTWGLTLLVALSVAPLVAGRSGTPGVATALRGVIDAVVVVGLVMLTHRLAAAVCPSPAVSPIVEFVGWTMVGLASVVLFALKTALTLAPRSAVAQWLWPWLFSGLHLDERVTRLTFLLWPPRLPPPPPQTIMLPLREPAGVSP